MSFNEIMLFILRLWFAGMVFGVCMVIPLVAFQFHLAGFVIGFLFAFPPTWFVWDVLGKIESPR